jgi:hypothetical protein
VVYQHEARGADKVITDAIDTHVQAEQICTVRAVMRPDLRGRLSASDRERPPVTGVNGPPMGPARVAAREGSDAGFPVSRKMVIARYAGWPSCGRHGRFALAGYSSCWNP